jgi:osmoprotectant transport system ATP-binding protein
VRKEFKALDELKKKTIILVTHDVQEAFELGDRIGLMDKGKMQQLATPTELLFKPANGFVQQFLQQQLFQLEWQSVSLKNIWNDLPEATNSRSAITLSSEETLWKALEVLTNNNEAVLAFDEQTQTYKAISFVQLKTAIQNQKHPA